ncbi:MAG: undecaprenyl-diphosphatase UppP [Calditrichaeota bacterium]|nr:undecaprenyl-diphosphatase UppP [Calditrichota bacterium]MCB9090122.1 undecaprenyl-diphosphatase UppP [Calditrichia bacterium]
MNETIKAIILGIVQGLSEFLPISSSGHLVLFTEILDFHKEGIAFDVFVHFGTLVAVLVVFRKDVWEMIRWLPAVPAFVMNGMKIERQEDEFKAMSFYIIVGTIPAAVIGLLFEKMIEGLFTSMLLVLGALLLTALVMFSSRYTRESQPFMNLFHAILIGFAQAFAIIPGISRSGSTIVTALWLGIKRETAARFSFLLSVPVILGASILKMKELLENPPPSGEILNLTLGTIAAAISGYLAIVWMLDIIRRQKLEWFGLYCAIVSIVGIVWHFMQG